MASLMNEFAAAFQFFPQFGENWLALKDCLESLNDWLPSDVYTLIVEDANLMLANETDAILGDMLYLLNHLGNYWSHEASVYDESLAGRTIPFHTLLHVTDPNHGDRLLCCAAENSVMVRRD